jgi:HAD superfamily hydrolase (TIGR01509 family)
MASESVHPKAIIFDFDGTLTDSMPLHIKAWIALMHDNGIEMTTQQYWESGVGGKAAHAAIQFMGDHLSFEEGAALADQKEFLYRYLAEHELELIDGADRFLRRLKAAGYPMAIATSGNDRNAAFQIKILRLEGLFDCVITSDDVERGKPEPDIFLLAAKGLGIAPSECLVFEDSHPGIMSANRAGMPVIAVSSAHDADTLAILPGVEFVIEDFNDERLNNRFFAA